MLEVCAMRSCRVKETNQQRGESGRFKKGGNLINLVALWPAILRFAAALAALILRLRPAGCDLGVLKNINMGAGWACDSQIAAG